MSIRFKTRSTTPGDVRLASGTLANLIATTDIKDGIGRGDGATGSYSPGGTYLEGVEAGGQTQLTTDRDEVDAVKAYISTFVTELLGTVDGTLNMALYGLLTDYTDPGVEHVEDGVGYTYAGVALEGEFIGGGNLERGDTIQAGVFTAGAGGDPAMRGDTILASVLTKGA
jgi:hypothetical protein